MSISLSIFLSVLWVSNVIDQYISVYQTEISVKIENDKSTNQNPQVEWGGRGGIPDFMVIYTSSPCLAGRVHFPNSTGRGRWRNTLQKNQENQPEKVEENRFVGKREINGNAFQLFASWTHRFKQVIFLKRTKLFYTHMPTRLGRVGLRARYVSVKQSYGPIGLFPSCYSGLKRNGPIRGLTEIVTDP